MTRPREILFILADGGRARLVTRRPDDGAFVTLREIEGSARLEALRLERRARPPGRTQESASPARRAIGREDYYRQAREAFMGEVADAAVEACQTGPCDGMVVVAPARLIRALRVRLEPRGAVLADLARDLTKVPDAELGRWLSGLTMAAG